MTVLTQQEWVEGQHGSRVRGGLGNDQGDQINVEAGQSVERSGHYSPHGVTNQHHTLRGGLQMLAGREGKRTLHIPERESLTKNLVAPTPLLETCTV